MKTSKPALPGLGLKTGLFSVLQLALAQAFAAPPAAPEPPPPLELSKTPLFLGTPSKANVLMMYGNSNSMDADPTGKAVGSNKPESKSEVARVAIKEVVNNYMGYINMGLLAYQQSPLDPSRGLRLINLYDSQYDVSYNKNDYDPAFTGARNSSTKKFMLATKNGGNVYFNVNLPFYSSHKGGEEFCYASTACTDPTHDFWGIGTASAATNCKAREPEKGSDWDNYQCYGKKTTASNGAPASSGAGYASYLYGGEFFPTDSDYGQGITDFGKRLTQQWVGEAWFVNTSPGKGYLHVPVAALDKPQADKIRAKLATSRFTSTDDGTKADVPLQNAGLSPLEGTVMTANTYFNGGTLSAGEGGAKPAVPATCSRNFLITLTDGLPSVTFDGKASANVAASLSGLTKAVTDLRGSSAGVETYVVGFALPYGVSITQLDDIAAAGGSGKAYYADDTETLNAAFSKIFTSILEKTSAASSVALNSQSVPTDAHVFQAKFSPTDWSGQLLDYAIGKDGKLESSYRWDAGALLAAPDFDKRVILTSNPTLGKQPGIRFRWPVDAAKPTKSELDETQVAALNRSAANVADGKGALRLNYLRGLASNEGEAPKFRKRPTSKLGDMVNSAPLFVGMPAANYGAPFYRDFRKAQASRPGMIYVGANDGMLHGFDAKTGVERLAYVPSGVFDNLSKLTDPGYVHRYYVDGSPSSGDVFYDNAWHTVLVGSMGAGARGIFALDITNPSNFSEAAAKALVNFEFTDKHDADIGHIAGPVSIVKLNNGRWAAMFGNGYNSTGSGAASLFLVDIESGELISKLSTGAVSAGFPNALAPPLAIDSDNNLTVDVVYAGDLMGNMWKFDLSGTSQNDWKAPALLFQASQPITTSADAGEHPAGGYMVYFGTGKYLEATDVSVPSTKFNTMYGIWDKGAAVALSDLVKQELVPMADIKGVGYRSSTSKPVDYAVKKGWYVDFMSKPERLVSDPVLRGGRVIFTTIVPMEGECANGGESWLNELDWLNGGLLDKPPFDTDLNGKVNTDDALAAGRHFKRIVSGASIQRSPTGDDLELKFFNESSGAISSVTESANTRSARRLSWRQIK